ncbi:bifunctional ADP-dependent NAD(P)H-hydrate dehydratase/NAD(P)H-hydrate epimerase [Acinetobacter lwoffii]|uniref:Bifunctional NAD(P)H-hydrate repair enzyme n=1 Tax=Acinetobacter lwoffii NCTC 5866 = CIP 64.10 = NIPH 512 TaxID=981327 RepID=A0ABP2ZGE9_ACILW|nr:MULTISPECIES: bifunctional ADP-dependent NAD(P)H-hydrate dehydratase/NAD(P)H-hydrate epimerase [Acinetobacter]ENU17158.1 YjeF family domain-containing protein [Acinetobacter sp. CIP A162]ESJ96592.1 YjeF family domain-containing protein [Acinetobacter lwoffii NCTC 5866 = CIP 64.10 = NIPH 512]QXB39942.1 bifunctional ADP-dependent NAD(P)H-hydrate dehydratase/NAD(P)H-hydrate epimerase [Acinetobacter lwoffii]SUU36803.1 sugar kinase [Acinetobacter lwoffii]VFQ39567.1 sugar kinase [Acinetobacter lw
MQQQVYHSRDLQAWEQRWFQQQNSSYGLMQQVAWGISQRLITLFSEQKIKKIAVCCGPGNNAGDGYLVAKYLKQAGFQVDIYAAELGPSPDLVKAIQDAKQADLQPYSHFDFQTEYEAYIDALFGIGLNRQLDSDWQNVIQTVNQQTGLKISIDIPSGLDANTGQPLPVAIKADYTFTGLGLKAGLFTGQGKEYAGKIELISAIPTDAELQPIAQLASHQIQLPKREAFGHKGSYGHVLVIGGHADMGGAVIMAAEAAFAAGAGKVTIVCDAKHHTAILSRAPNVMLRDINLLTQEQRQALIQQVDAVCFGMGLGRDSWSEQQYTAWFELTQQSDLEVVLDADALWFLAKQPQVLNSQTYATPHPGEAATLLACSTAEVEMDRIAAIHALQQKYQGQWVLKGSGSLILEERLYICNAGNAGMGTGGMGDVLAGMIASLKAQFAQKIYLHEIVTLHALAGDELAKNGERGLQAQNMKHAIYQVVNR